MVKNLSILLLLAAAVTFAYHEALFIFFAQDDFILINYFSGGNLWQDLKNALGWPSVTHFRPIHNLYFLISGNLFERNYIGFHLITFAFHIGGSFFIFKVIQRLIKNSFLAFAASILYAIHPAHFVSLFWISGGATVIGFFFLMGSIYSFLVGNKLTSFFLYVFALLASESMVVGVILFYFLKRLKQKRFSLKDHFLMLILISSIFFISVRLLFLTSGATFLSYPFDVSTKTFGAVFYYLLRIVGFAEVSGDYLVSIIILVILSCVLISLINNILKKKDPLLLILFGLTIGAGLFPFIFIPSHMSPHYMNISIFGFASLMTLSLKHVKPFVSLLLFLIFVISSIININLIKNNNWVVKRSNLAQAYVQRIQNESPVGGSTLIFDDNVLSTSDEAFITLGGGEAIKFWFPDKNYKTCFSAFENC